MKKEYKKKNGKMGIYYYGGNSDAEKIAKDMIQNMIQNGASNKSWVKPDTASRFGRLGWIRDTQPFTLLIECGFMQDLIDDNADEKYAKWVAQALCAVFEKAFKYDLDKPATNSEKPSWKSKYPIETEPEWQYINKDNEKYQRWVNEGNIIALADELTDRVQEIKENKIIRRKAVKDLAI